MCREFESCIENFMRMLRISCIQREKYVIVENYKCGSRYILNIVENLKFQAYVEISNCNTGQRLRINASCEFSLYVLVYLFKMAESNDPDCEEYGHCSATSSKFK